MLLAGDAAHVHSAIGGQGLNTGVQDAVNLLIWPDGYAAWVGDRTQLGLTDALTTWFGPPADPS